MRTERPSRRHTNYRIRNYNGFSWTCSTSFIAKISKQRRKITTVIIIIGRITFSMHTNKHRASSRMVGGSLKTELGVQTHTTSSTPVRLLFTPDTSLLCCTNLSVHSNQHIETVRRLHPKQLFVDIVDTFSCHFGCFRK